MKHLIGFPNLSESYFQKKNLLVVTKPNRIVIFFFFKYEKRIREISKSQSNPKEASRPGLCWILKTEMDPSQTDLPQEQAQKSGDSHCQDLSCVLFFPFWEFLENDRPLKPVYESHGKYLHF